MLLDTLGMKYRKPDARILTKRGTGPMEEIPFYYRFPKRAAAAKKQLGEAGLDFSDQGKLYGTSTFNQVLNERMGADPQLARDLELIRGSRPTMPREWLSAILNAAVGGAGAAARREQTEAASADAELERRTSLAQLLMQLGHTQAARKLLAGVTADVAGEDISQALSEESAMNVAGAAKVLEETAPGKAKALADLAKRLGQPGTFGEDYFVGRDPELTEKLGWTSWLPPYGIPNFAGYSPTTELGRQLQTMIDSGQLDQTNRREAATIVRQNVDPRVSQRLKNTPDEKLNANQLLLKRMLHGTASE